MKYDFFREFAMNNDQRNLFTEPIIKKMSFLPEILREFYSTYNTEDVLITFDDLTTIKFYSIEDISELQKDYDVPSHGFIFATYESDPIWVDDGSVFIGVHGIDSNVQKKISNDLLEFFTSIVFNEVSFM